jgi:hypothetical protein
MSVYAVWERSKQNSNRNTNGEMMCDPCDRGLPSTSTVAEAVAAAEASAVADRRATEDRMADEIVENQRLDAERAENAHVHRILQEKLSQENIVIRSSDINGQDFESQQRVIDRQEAMVITVTENLKKIREDSVRAMKAAEEAAKMLLIVSSQAKQTRLNISQGNTIFHSANSVRHRGACLVVELLGRIHRDLARMEENKFCRMHLVVNDKTIERNIRNGGSESGKAEMAKILLRLAMASCNREVPMYSRAAYYVGQSETVDPESVENAELNLDGPDSSVVLEFMSAFVLAANASAGESFWAEGVDSDRTLFPFYEAVVRVSRRRNRLTVVQCAMAIMCYLAVPGGLRHMLAVASRVSELDPRVLVGSITGQLATPARVTGIEAMIVGIMAALSA